VAGVLGAPVDLTTMALRPFGYSVPAEQVVGGSDYIGRQMERAGLISGKRRPIAEMLGGLVSPDPADAAKLGAMFIGPLAKTWDAAAAQKAVDMEAAGIDPRKIWEETGTWRAPDQMLRQEISDLSAEYKPGSAYSKANQQNIYTYNSVNDADTLRNIMERQNIGVGEAKEKFKEIMQREPHEHAGSLAKFSTPTELSVMLKRWEEKIQSSRDEWVAAQKDVLEHPELYSSYPDIQQMPFRVKPENSMENYAGTYSPLLDEITLSSGHVYGLGKGKSINLHELQHAIQERENFARGGNTEMFLDEKSPYQQYLRLAGEAEARATQSRMGLTPQQRRALFPEESYDVPIRELIVLPRSGK
jgi:hypothetical protein